MSRATLHAVRATSVSNALLPALNGLMQEAEVLVRCKLNRSQISELEQAGRFPKRKTYGFQHVAWLAVRRPTDRLCVRRRDVGQGVSEPAGIVCAPRRGRASRASCTIFGPATHQGVRMK
jgi:hypothetical protein